MSSTNLKTFLTKVKTHPALKARLDEISTPADLVQLGAEHGFEFTEAEVLDFAKARQQLKEAQTNQAIASLQKLRDNMTQINGALQSGDHKSLDALKQQLAHCRTEMEELIGPPPPEIQRQAEKLKNLMLRGDTETLAQATAALKHLRDLLDQRQLP